MTARPRAVIIGMMGAGKTRVGKEVAHMLRLPFADADVEIEREVGMKIPSYFEEYGEPAFREVEADLIADMLEDFARSPTFMSIPGGLRLRAQRRK